jgi:fatty-acyl-CoA synthase
MSAEMISTGADMHGPMLSGDLLGERARLTPEKIGLVDVALQQRFTYRELNERAERVAAMWQNTCGLGKGDRLGILAHNRLEFLDAFFAAGKSGVVLVPLNTRLTISELEYIVRDSGLKALLHAGDFAETIQKLKQSVPLDHWLALDQPLDSGDISCAEALADVREIGHGATPCHPEDLYCVLYTSGTTGKPKGVMIPHRMVVWNAYNTVLSWQLREGDVGPIFTPLYHAGGLGVFLTPLVAIGGTIVLHRGFDAAEVLCAIERERCTVVFGVPTILKMLSEMPGFESADLRHVRWFISGGAPLPLSLIESYRKRGQVLKQGYGLTEVGVNCFAMTAEEALRAPGSIGKPMLFTQAKLVNSQGSVLGAGEVGELLLRGPHVSKGYWNNPEATTNSVDKDGWFRTGDLARFDDEGFFYVAGRRKEMFISGGENVYPAEVEQVLLAHPDVRDAAVIGVPHPKWGEVGVAYLVATTATRSVPRNELMEFAGARLARYKIPKEFIFVSDLPRTSSGKVRKDNLYEKYSLKERKAY